MYSVASDRRRLPGFPIRKSTDQRLFAAPRSLSQLITPFIACPYQGIHHEPYQCLTPTILHMPRQDGKFRRVGRAQSQMGDTHRFALALACSAGNTQHATGNTPKQPMCCTVQCGLTYHYVKRTTPYNTCQGVVELVGFEPTTSCLQSRCSTD